MEGYDWVYLKDQVRQIRENTVTARSRTTYQNSYCHFLAWLLENKTHRIAPPFTECIEGIGTYTPQQLRTRVKEAINQDLRVDPLIFDTLAAEDFVIWLVTLKRKDDDALSYSALNTHRADLCDLFRDYGKTMSKRWSRSLPPISKGLKHTFATDAPNEASEIKTDKDPLMFGLTACPSSTAIHLRAGWSLGGVQNTYLHYEAAGDMHVGRTVAGLPTESYKFSTLPPRDSDSDEIVQRGVPLMFPGLPERLEFIAEYCLASLTYHHSYLTRALSPKHPAFQPPLFQDAPLLSSLTKRLQTGDGSSDA
ncbi:hypothetical protein L914_13755 [Phytophthora nicotianae]|uniref:Core-binding (CB) domain-containing protein n=1 Tax=Phytophthora nicotianae TaxID=4792 RepID=W2MX95_PHYNI|nr:hypothetical protein L914_13755 [Phytophthora nicotianae]